VPWPGAGFHKGAQLSAVAKRARPHAAADFWFGPIVSRRAASTRSGASASSVRSGYAVAAPEMLVANGAQVPALVILGVEDAVGYGGGMGCCAAITRTAV
jgi:hypothetical protein